MGKYQCFFLLMNIVYILLFESKRIVKDKFRYLKEKFNINVVVKKYNIAINSYSDYQIERGNA